MNSRQSQTRADVCGCEEDNRRLGVSRGEASLALLCASRPAHADDPEGKREHLMAWREDVPKK